MNRHPVTSTLIKSLGYEVINDIGVLEVEFKGGEIYRYSDVPQSKYDLLLDLNAKFESVGKYFNEYIKTQYRVERVNKTSDPDAITPSPRDLAHILDTAIVEGDLIDVLGNKDTRCIKMSDALLHQISEILHQIAG